MNAVKNVKKPRVSTGGVSINNDQFGMVSTTHLWICVVILGIVYGCLWMFMDVLWLSTLAKGWGIPWYSITFSAGINTSILSRMGDLDTHSSFCRSLIANG
jgi:hypothetical protein